MQDDIANAHIGAFCSSKAECGSRFIYSSEGIWPGIKFGNTLVAQQSGVSGVAGASGDFSHMDSEPLLAKVKVTSSWSVSSGLGCCTSPVRSITRAETSYSRSLRTNTASVEKAGQKNWLPSNAILC